MQYEGDDLLVLVSGAQPSYTAGDSVHLNLLINNQSTGYVQVRLRTKLLGVRFETIDPTVKQSANLPVDNGAWIPDASALANGGQATTRWC
jgi:hypothetical protein